MKDKLVTLIGGGGFLGRYVAQGLLKAGARVRVAQRDPRQAFFLRTQGGLGQTQFVAADVTRPDTVARALVGADAAVNLVGVLSGDFQRVHVEGAQAVARAAADAGIGSLVHISAIGADADAPSAYGRSKAAGEEAMRAAFPRVTVLRPSVVFGAEDGFINRFADLIRKTPVVPVLRGAARFQPVFVGDVAQATVAALATPARHAGHVYELGGPDIWTMLELNRWIAEATGRSPRFVEVPDAIGALIARAGSLPGAPISQDQWRSLGRDSVVAPGAEGLAALGVEATPLATVAPEWLVRFRRHGRFSLHPKNA